jgi:tRNA pseudouridine38-40 synthase
MARYLLRIEYDGGPFQGWQRVGEGLASVQGALETAAARLNGGAPSPVWGAGRTDAGVHALGQAAHLDLTRPMRPDRLRDALNAHLRPDPISVLHAEAVEPEFHARFDAVRRCYRYRILNRRSPPALDAGRVWQVMRPLDCEAMQAAADLLVGMHDFTTFRDSQCQAKSPVKTLERCTVARRGEDVEITCEAPSFLHRQVRSMVGTLVEVGVGRRSAQSVGAALAARDRALCGVIAPAWGLYLTAVEHPAPDVRAARRPSRPPG